MNVFGKKPAGAAANSNAKKPTVRRETVLVPVAKQQTTTPRAASASRPGPPKDRFKLSQTSKSRPSPAQSLSAKKQIARRAVAGPRGVKRKSATPQPDGPLFSSDEEDDSSDIGTSDSDVSRKRVKSSVSSIESSGPRRRLALSREDTDGKDLRFVHGADLTSGDEARYFRNPWDMDSFETIELQYPSKSQLERFELRWPKKNTDDDYRPMEDVIETVKAISDFYLPDEQRSKALSEETGYERRFNRAFQRQSIPEFVSVIEDFNAMLKPLVEDGTIQRQLSRETNLTLEWVKRILDQTYARTVSPKVDTLRAYQNGSDNVYGELLARFVSDIFRKTRLNHEQVFVDLGSGVGNVVMQAALEVGCESWAIEMMPNPCDLAELQARELPARAKLWGLNIGDIHLLRGDFTENLEIGPVLRKADVVLVNNQAFTPALNDKLISMFLDLKDGCQVVSLKPFVPDGHKMTVRNVDNPCNMFRQTQYEYFSDCVSWGAQHGHYYVAVKDSRPLMGFRKKMGLQ